MMIDPIELAKELGFSKCCIFAPEPFTHYERRRNDGALHANGTKLTADPPAETPWANAIITLIWAYRPYAPTVPLSGNYPSANAAYHAAGQMLVRLQNGGIRAERIYVPVRELLLRNHAGIALRNGLTAVPPYGTRISVQTIAAAIPNCVYTEAALPESQRLCESCKACVTACPSAAIREEGYDFHRCIRAYMGKDVMPECVMERMTSMLGCEICQNVCPYNRSLDVDPELPEAFSYEKLLKHELDDALQLVGTNQKSGGRIEAHAAILAARDGRRDLLAEIEALLADPRALVRESARYAIMRLRAEE